MRWLRGWLLTLVAFGAGAADPPCDGDYVRCPADDPSGGICVPTLTPWCGFLVYKNPFAPLKKRVNDLTARLTLEQKVNLLQTSPVNNSGVPELGIDTVTMSECLHGYCSRTPSTLFPQSISLAASFNPLLVRRVAAAIATEGRAWRNNWTATGNLSVAPPSLVCFAPQINIVRDPRWGRGQETYGEDPALTAAMAAAYVRHRRTATNANGFENPLRIRSCARAHSTHISNAERSRARMRTRSRMHARTAHARQRALSLTHTGFRAPIRRDGHARQV